MVTLHIFIIVNNTNVIINTLYYIPSFIWEPTFTIDLLSVNFDGRTLFVWSDSNFIGAEKSHIREVSSICNLEISHLVMNKYHQWVLLGLEHFPVDYVSNPYTF